MKLCWDSIENIKLTKKGNFCDVVKNKIFYLGICKQCEEECLMAKGSKFCSQSCANRYISTNRIVTDEIKNNISLGNRDFYRNNNIPKYALYFNKLQKYEEVRQNKEDSNVLEVRCFKCKEWFVPKLSNVLNRIAYLYYNRKSDSLFYCSNKCKNSCSIFGKSPEQIIKEDAVRAGRLPWLELRREIQLQLRKIVLKRDNYTCQKCGATENLECHHIYPVSIEPLLSADIDNCITYCKACHLKAHQKEGCRRQDLLIEIC